MLNNVGEYKSVADNDSELTDVSLKSKKFNIDYNEIIKIHKTDTDIIEEDNITTNGMSLPKTSFDTTAIIAAVNNIDDKNENKVNLKEICKYLCTSFSLILLFFASFYRNCGGMVWGYQAQNFFINEKNQTNNEVAQWIGWIPAVGGSIGCFLGGIISDIFAINEINKSKSEIVMSQAYMGMDSVDSGTNNAKNSSIVVRLWILVVANAVSFPLSAGVLILNVPYCYLSYFFMYFVSEMWISVCVTLVVEFVPNHLKNTFLSLYYFTLALGGYAPLLVTPLQNLLNSYFWSIFVLFPVIYGTSSLFFFLVIFTYKRDLYKSI